MGDAMLTYLSFYRLPVCCVRHLPHSLLQALCAVLTLSFVTVGTASADDTIIVIPTVNSDVQSHAAVTVGSRLSRAGYRVASPDPLLQMLNMGPVVSRSDLLMRGNDIMTAIGKAIIVLVDLEITETRNRSPRYEIRLSSEIYEPGSQQLVASWAVPNTSLVPPARPRPLARLSPPTLCCSLGRSSQLYTQPVAPSPLAGRVSAVMPHRASPWAASPAVARPIPGPTLLGN